MVPAAYSWTTDQAFCVTVVMGLDAGGTCAALGGTAWPGTVTGLEYFNTSPRTPNTDLVALLPVDLASGPATVLLEGNGIRGIDDDVLAKLSIGGYALSAFQNVNLLIYLFGAAREGTAVAQTMSEDWAKLRQLRVDEPLPCLPVGAALPVMREIGFMPQEHAETLDMDVYLAEIADFWPHMFEFVRRATGVDLTDDVVLGPGWTIVELPSFLAVRAGNV